jgi:hypothetical protein
MLAAYLLGGDGGEPCDLGMIDKSQRIYSYSEPF